MKQRASLFFLLILALVFDSCNVTRNYPPKDYLLINNKFVIDNKKIDKDELSGYLQQFPNDKLFGVFRANIAFYNLGSKGRDTKSKKWIRTKLGATPILLDTSLSLLAKKQMIIYLGNKGFFQSRVEDSIVYKKQRATVFYVVKTKQPYTVHNIIYSVQDSSLASFVMKDTSKCLIRPGKNYDAYLLSDERARITNNLTNYGFYKFSSSYIIFHIDSSLSARQMDIRVEIRNPNYGKHHRYFINNIYIYPEFDLLDPDTLTLDTLVRTYRAAGPDTIFNTYYYLYRNDFSIKPRTIAQAIIIKSGTPFNIPEVNYTYTQLTALQVFKFVNIQFREVPQKDSTSPHLLDCKIQLSRSTNQTFSVSADGTNSSGAFGMQGNFSAQHRNLFGGAQQFRLNLSASAQMQGNLGSSIKNNLLNSIELGANANLTFPQFLIPIRPERLAKSFHPRTTITVGYNYQRQPDYSRHITNMTFGYTWNQNRFIRHILNPVELSFVKIYKDSTFTAKLERSYDKRLKNQYTDHMVAGLKYNITYSSQDVTKLSDFVYIRSNIETGGNLVYLVDKIFKLPKSENGAYHILNTPYSQYLRPDIDIRYYHLITPAISWVARFYGGIGVPYGNSTILPFEKAFFAGGANDLRGWKMGSLGPGSYHTDTIVTTFDQTGDMQLQFNFEYRFPVYRFIRSAFFVDAGNVWLLNNNPDYPGGKFGIRTFAPQVAIDVGLGIRADFDFFIFRLDPAVPIRVPWTEGKGHWYFNKIQLRDILWNFGIGYPF